MGANIILLIFSGYAQLLNRYWFGSIFYQVWGHYSFWNAQTWEINVRIKFRHREKTRIRVVLAMSYFKFKD